VGETGNVLGDYSVSITDELLARNNPVSAIPGANVLNRFDYNRDGAVSVIDQLLSRNNLTTTATKLQEITMPSALSSAQLAPQGLDDAISGLALSLTLWRAPELQTSSVRSTGEAAISSDRSTCLRPQAIVAESPGAADCNGLHRRSKAVDLDDDLLELLHSGR
jgi:hypothetical protein